MSSLPTNTEKYRSEGRFRTSRRNPDCRNPHLWHSRTASSTEIEVSEFVGALARCLQPELVVETGTNIGQTSYFIGEALLANGHGKLVTIEPNKRVWRYARRRCKRLPVDCVLGEALKWEPDGQTIDMMFFDSEPDSRPLEFQHFRPYMNPFTVLVWHDAAITHRIYRRHLKRLIRSKSIQPLFLPTPRGLCLARLAR